MYWHHIPILKSSNTVLTISSFHRTRKQSNQANSKLRLVNAYACPVTHSMVNMIKLFLNTIRPSSRLSICPSHYNYFRRIIFRYQRPSRRAHELVRWGQLGAIQKLRHTLRGGGGRRSVTLCDKGEGILNFVTHFKNSIKAILHISTKLKQCHWKALNIAHWTT